MSFSIDSSLYISDPAKIPKSSHWAVLVADEFVDSDDRGTSRTPYLRYYAFLREADMAPYIQGLTLDKVPFSVIKVAGKGVIKTQVIATFEEPDPRREGQ